MGSWPIPGTNVFWLVILSTMSLMTELNFAIKI